MLVYVDAAKFIKVYRSGQGGRRHRLGVIAKRNHEFRADANVDLTDEERAEMAKVVESYQAAEAAKVRANALAFPELAREIAEYYVEHATDLEKGLISVAVLEMMRAIRKAERGEDESEEQAA